MTTASYPRPQLWRAHWQSLDGEWRFTFDDELRLEHPRDVREWPHLIQVPFCPESSKSGIGDGGFHCACWYQREFSLVPPEGRAILHFGAVDYAARVWINDTFIIEHEGGYTPFSADITQALLPSGQQRITLRAEDDPHDLEKPRGKQDWQRDPHGIWYVRTSGIWQTVWLEIVPITYIERIRWTPHLERWEIGFEAVIDGPVLDHATRLSVRLTRGHQLLVDDSYQVIGGDVHRRLALSDPGIDDYRNDLLWSPERPTLLDAEVKLWIGDRVIDEIRSYTALRSVNVQRDRLLLNGRQYYLRLVLDQGYWPDSLMTPPRTMP